ncbi:MULTISPECIES: hypothetical protein [Limosilactobacillus]|uniref:Uncharacterized protein n=1 Tax=Limosilactobacillus reuteri CF48-3A TaxID=525341 RepID=A0A8D9RY01_LIMRT|nr:MULTISPECIES: hypothetical protein [Limosilactobacillus]EEI65273.1 hypothetical protein HMPREF0534_1398 [Limosilactobacillus reuteri CF48-3A]
MEEKREIITLNFISTPSPMTTPVKRIVAKVEFNGICLMISKGC